MTNNIPRVVTNRSFEFDGELYEILTMDYDSNIARLRKADDGSIISVRIDGVRMIIEGELI